jgi:hypothetical protein
MLQNVGTTDRVIRIVAGAGLIAGSFFVPGLWRWIALPGVVLLLTGAVRVCPGYMPFGIRTTRSAHGSQTL